MEKEKKAYIDLEVWKEARFLASEIYLVTKSYPKDEMFGLVSQMRRCAVSVQFLRISLRAAVEIILKTAFNFSLSLEVQFTNWKLNSTSPSTKIILTKSY